MTTGRVLTVISAFIWGVVSQDTTINGALGDGGTGPAPSIVGSIDNVFKSIKNYDEHRCLERMLCEYMMPKDEEERDVRPSPIRGGVPFGPQPQGSFSPQRPFEDQSQTFNNQFPQSNFPPQHFDNRFSRPPQPSPFGPQFSPNRRKETLLGSILSLVGKRRKRRKKRQTNLQGNILRLMKATGLDSLNVYPYVRAGLIGQASDPLVRGGNSCSRMYRRCRMEPDRLLSYFNNHNGGIVNQVQPSVDNEIGPIVSAIISDLAEENSSGTGSVASQASSPTGLLSGAGGLLSSFLSGGNSGGGLLSSITQAEGGLINNAVDAITDFIHGPGPNGKK